MAGSGFVIFKRFDDGIKLLGLIGPEFHRERTNGTYDIPKGTIDLGESPYQTAVRECYEEAGYNITNNNVHAGPYKDGLFTIWLAEVYTDPVIGVNPENGIVEHEGYEWLKPEDLLNGCYNYLIPTIKWACAEIANV